MGAPRAFLILGDRQHSVSEQGRAMWVHSSAVTVGSACTVSRTEVRLLDTRGDKNQFSFEERCFLPWFIYFDRV